MPDPTPAPASPVGGIIKSLPLEVMFGAPLDAAVKAQVASSKSTADYMQAIGFNADGTVKVVRATFNQMLCDKDGNPKQLVKRVVDAPLLALLPIPALA